MHLPPPRPKVRQILLLADRKNQPQSMHQLVAGGHESWPSQHRPRRHGSAGNKKQSWDFLFCSKVQTHVRRNTTAFAFTVEVQGSYSSSN